MQVVFLDIDGVIRKESNHCAEEYWDQWEEILRRQSKKSEIGFDFLQAELSNREKKGDLGFLGQAVLSTVFEWNKTAITYLKELLSETNARIVVSSSWRFYGEPFMKALLSIHDLDKYYFGSTIHIDYPDSPVEKAIITKWRRWKSLARDYYEKKLKSNLIDERVIEISEYLDRCREITSFAVLDDSALMKGYGYVKTHKPLISPSDIGGARVFLMKKKGPFALDESLITPDLSDIRDYISGNRELAESGWFRP